MIFAPRNRREISVNGDKMEIGISTASLFGRMYNEDAVTAIENLGAKVCEVFLETYCEYTEEYASLINSRKTENLKVHSIHTLNTHFEPQLFSTCDRNRKDALDIFENCLKTGRVLGAKYYTLHGKARLKKNAVFTNYEEIGCYMNALTELTEKYGMQLCLENVEWAYYREPGFFKSVKEYAPKLCACLDVKQAREAGFDYNLYLEEMGDSLRTVHLSDVDEFGKIAIPSEKGLFDFEELFRKLKYNGFKGNCVIEIYKENFKDIQELKCSLEYLMNIKDKIFKE